MAWGVPVISTKCGGPEAYVQQDVNGYLCNFDAAEITKQATKLLENEDRYFSFAKAARSSVLETYAQNVFERNLAKHWSDLRDFDI